MLNISFLDDVNYKDLDLSSKQEMLRVIKYYYIILAKIHRIQIFLDIFPEIAFFLTLFISRTNS